MMQIFAAAMLCLALAQPSAAATPAASATPGSGTDRIVRLTLDGRPVDRSSGSAILHNGVVYGDLVDLVRSFDGILTFQHTVTVVSISGVTATYTLGSRTAKLGLGSAVMSGPVIMHAGDVFVPLEFFVTRVVNAKVRISPDRKRADIFANSSPLN